MKKQTQVLDLLKSLMKTLTGARQSDDEKKSADRDVLKGSLDDDAKEVKQQQKPTQKKFQFNYKLYKRIGILLGVLLLGYGIYLLFKPYQGGMMFGACKVFLELNVTYPTELRYSTVEIDNRKKAIRMWYVRTDAFGEYRLENMQCFFEPDPAYGFKMTAAKVDRRPVEQVKIDSFNKSLGAIFAYPPDLTYPPPLPDKLEDLQK